MGVKGRSPISSGDLSLSLSLSRSLCLTFSLPRRRVLYSLQWLERAFFSIHDSSMGGPSHKGSHSAGFAKLTGACSSSGAWGFLDSWCFAHCHCCRGFAGCSLLSHEVGFEKFIGLCHRSTSCTE